MELINTILKFDDELNQEIASKSNDIINTEFLNHFQDWIESEDTTSLDRLISLFKQHGLALTPMVIQAVYIAAEIRLGLKPASHSNKSILKRRNEDTKWLAVGLIQELTSYGNSVKISSEMVAAFIDREFSGVGPFKASTLHKEYERQKKDDNSNSLILKQKLIFRERFIWSEEPLTESSYHKKFISLFTAKIPQGIKGTRS